MKNYQYCNINRSNSNKWSFWKNFFIFFSNFILLVIQYCHENCLKRYQKYLNKSWAKNCTYIITWTGCIKNISKKIEIFFKPNCNIFLRNFILICRSCFEKCWSLNEISSSQRSIFIWISKRCAYVMLYVIQWKYAYNIFMWDKYTN